MKTSINLRYASALSSIGLCLLLAACAGKEQASDTVETQSSPVADRVEQPAERPAPQPLVSQEQKKQKVEMTQGVLARSRAPATSQLADQAIAFSPAPYAYQEQNRENYKHFKDNGLMRTVEQPFSTFSIDVDTGAYSNVRRFLNHGQLPNQDAVRAEEMINYFSYQYAYPDNAKRPFAINTEIAPTPWNKNTYLLHIGLQAYQQSHEQRPASNLVFLVDVSGSMQSPDKLELLKSGLKLLVRQLSAKDTLSIVSYAGSTGVVLEPTAGDQHAKMEAALDRLSAGGSTNGAGGIQLAYSMARQSYIKGGINRILLATDGDFNVGVTDFEALRQMVEQKRKQGVSLTTLGFGTGNYNDHLMEQLADVGNGNYSYIDTLQEARKVLVEEMQATLNTIASDVKIQVEFNPAQVAEYRLVGYENRALQREDFNNDKVDAGEIGENHSVTALYEITLTDSAVKRLEKSRYAEEKTVNESRHSKELAFLRVRYKTPGEQQSQLIEKVIQRSELTEQLDKSSNNFRFAAAVAAFAQQLRGGKNLQQFEYDDIARLANGARGDDLTGYRAEFIQLVKLAKSLDS